jgi:hypothetical protein
LRTGKKYGPETSGPTGSLAGTPQYDGPDKRLVWIYDSQGKQLNFADVVGNRSDGCSGQTPSGAGVADIAIRKNEWRTYVHDQLKIIPVRHTLF